MAKERHVDLGTTVIEMRNITKKFGDFVANDGINLTVHKGEVHAILGENGAGKSTLMNLIGCLDTPTSGTIAIDGEELGEMDEDELALVYDLHLMTLKPVIYVCNVDEDAITEDNEYVKIVRAIAEKENAPVVVICGKIESEIAALESEEDRKEFLEASGLSESGLNPLIRAAYSSLGLRTFFTAGPDEDRAWTFKAGSKAPECAGIIHSDFEKGFIKAEVYSVDDLIAFGSEAKVREAGKLRLEGKEYIVQDGDIVFFRFNV